MYTSHLRASLARKYAVKHFLAVTERTKAVLYAGFCLAVVLLLTSYLTAHVLLYVTGYYNHPSIVITHHN